MIKCNECGRAISDNADKCPYCGNPIRKGMGCVSKFFVTIFVIIVALYILGSILPKDWTNDNTDYRYGQEMLAYNYAEDFVKQGLKAPSTAKFPSLTEKSQSVKNNYDGSYKIDSWVDSQNAFGVMIRKNFSCTVVFENGKVKCKNLVFE